MDDLKRTASARLSQISNLLSAAVTPTNSNGTKTIPWDPNSTSFPTRKQLPRIEGAPDEAAWVWGPEDFIGRLNLLTPTRVAAAAKEIKTGEIVPVNLPLQHPEQPAFGREKFKHEIKTLEPGVAYDDLYTLNTQSGTQWDGFRHFAHIASKTFYNGTKEADIVGPNANQKCSIHHWAEHGIAGRGVLLDFGAWAKKNGITYDPNDNFGFSYDQLAECGKSQGLDIRPAAQGGDILPGDILFIRGGWVAEYWNMSSEQRSSIGCRESSLGPDTKVRFCGILQEEKMLDWLHDSYFAAVSGDMPSFEAWPSHTDYYLHEYILARWGMPLGEMLDLEKLAAKCAERGRYTFFFSSSPANCINGVSSHVNGQAIF